MAVHEHAPVLATYVISSLYRYSALTSANSGSESGVVKVWNVNDVDVKRPEPISRFRNVNVARAAHARDHAVQPVTSMRFHPHEMILSVGAADAKLNVRGLAITQGN